MPCAMRLLGPWGPFSLCFWTAAAWSCNDPQATTFLRRKSLADVDSEARCNDGSPAAFYLQENVSSDTWLIYLAGGGWCYDLESCHGRFNGTLFPNRACSSSNESRPCYMSSKDYPAICGKTGIFDAVSSPLRYSNLVYVPYCTSDAFMGDTTFGPWHFRGARVVRSVLQALPRLRQARRLVFGGGSAGGRGAMTLLDEVRNLKVEVMGFLDSPYYLDVPSYSSKFAGFQMQHRAVLQNFNASSVLSGCKEVFPSEPWKCLFGEHRMPTVSKPYLIIAAQYDSWQLSHLVDGYDGLKKHASYDATARAYAEAFAHATRHGLRNLEGPGAYVYSHACYEHHISESKNFWTSKIEGLSQAQALEGRSAMDLCESFDCGCNGSGLADMLQSFLV